MANSIYFFGGLIWGPFAKLTGWFQAVNPLVYYLRSLQEFFGGEFTKPHGGWWIYQFFYFWGFHLGEVTNFDFYSQMGQAISLYFIKTPGRTGWEGKLASHYLIILEWFFTKWKGVLFIIILEVIGNPVQGFHILKADDNMHQCIISGEFPKLHRGGILERFHELLSIPQKQTLGYLLKMSSKYNTSWVPFKNVFRIQNS